jgi:hypothetical protein|tara:strand:- start:19 stop:648 length:630 start_codon:yes stop_codon:yes gene_type:complete
MASRDIHADISARLANDNHTLAFGVQFALDSGDVFVWTGIGDFTDSDNNTYTGAGELLSISNIEESKELQSTNLTISISGLSAEVYDAVTTENMQNRLVTLRLFFFHPDTMAEIENVILFKGRIDGITITDGDSFSIIFSCENKLVDLTRPKNLLYTPETQEYLYTGDKGLEFVPEIQEQQLFWGETFGGGTGGAGATGGDDGGATPHY